MMRRSGESIDSHEDRIGQPDTFPKWESRTAGVPGASERAGANGAAMGSGQEQG